jgi:hypothetical protein
VNFELVEEIAQAVLYEGYMLYPYRPSSVKNQQRFNFGVLCPASYCEAQRGSESSFMQTECLLKVTAATRVTVKVRFLHLVQRTIRKCESDGRSEYVDRLEVSGHIYQPWQEAEEGTFTSSALDPSLLSIGRTMDFSFPAGRSSEKIRDDEGQIAGEVKREWQKIDASLQLGVESCHDGVIKFTARINNLTNLEISNAEQSRDTALLYSMVSAHAILGVEDGEFISLLDPPAGFEDLARSCENKGAWPVLAGEDATTVLASPIILYDYPKIAPESAGNLFDGTEIDEILSLRILTLTDDEKKEIRQSDDRARDLLERTESIPDEQFMKLHGVLRGLTVLKEGSE